MEGLIALLLALILLSSIIIYNYLEKRRKNLQKKKDEYQALIKKIALREEELKRLTDEENNLRVQVIQVSNKLDHISALEKQSNERVKLANEQLNKLLADGRETMQAQLEVEAALRREAEVKALQEERTKILANMTKEQEEILKNIQPLKEELQEYESKRASIIEALQREKALEEQKDYYRICLSSEAIEDISYIKEIFGKLHNKGVIAEVIYKSYIAAPLKDMLNRVVGKEKRSGIYKITNIDTQECYIGQGVDIANRLTQHVKGTLGIQTIADQWIHRVMAEKGVENWTFEVLEVCSKEELSSREKYYINFYQSNIYGYNRTQGG